MAEKQIYTPHTGQPFEAEALKPCPCCGSKAELLFKGNDFTRKRSATIRCTNRLCRLQRTDGAIRNNSEWVGRTCIEAWNKRVTSEGK